jgi:hypothetical protein
MRGVQWSWLSMVVGDGVTRVITQLLDSSGLSTDEGKRSFGAQCIQTLGSEEILKEARSCRINMSCPSGLESMKPMTERSTTTTHDRNPRSLSLLSKISDSNPASSGFLKTALSFSCGRFTANSVLDLLFRQ